ncbi:MAG: hypothetical protein ACFBSC_11670 [Microcoleaceae cyanobacterium]
MNQTELERWFSTENRQMIAASLRQRVGITRIRAEYFVRLWVYLRVKQLQVSHPQLQPPLEQLDQPQGFVLCTHQEAADLFYSDSERGSDRAAGMMIDKLAELGLLRKHFDGNSTSVEILPSYNFLETPTVQTTVQLKPDQFDPRCDTVPIAMQLSAYYNWMYETTEAVPHRLVTHLRRFADQYPPGMRVLRRCDNFHPVGVYLLYPIAKVSDTHFFTSPNRKSSFAFSDEDGFQVAKPGDVNCLSIFIRSWMIDQAYIQDYRIPFIQDAQQVLTQIKLDFPNICDLYALLIHPSLEPMIQALGFQKLNENSHASISWIYLPLDRFMALDIPSALKTL